MSLSKTALSGLTLAETRALFNSPQMPDAPAWRGTQLYRWVRKGVDCFDAMSNLDAALRRRLAERCALRSSRLDGAFEDADGTVKLRLLTGDGLAVEAVILHDGAGRHTACLSCQAGCAMGCVFCKTGALGLRRGLSCAEIVEQVYHINGVLAARGRKAVENIVFMGMGEPLLNLEAVQKTCAILAEDGGGRGAAFSRKRITLSTCGLAEGIRRFTGEGPDIRLAVSLPSAREDLRRRLMPAASPPNPLRDALAEYQRARGRRVTLEVVLLGGVNTTAEDARALAAFARGLDVIVNLIPWNHAEGLLFEGVPLAAPGRREQEVFCGELERRGLKTVLRRRKGGGVGGACGQLGGTGPAPASR